MSLRLGIFFLFTGSIVKSSIQYNTKVIILLHIVKIYFDYPVFVRGKRPKNVW